MAQISPVGGVESLRQTLQNEIARFDRESTKHKRLHRRCQTAVIVLTGLSTIAAGAGAVFEHHPAIQFIVLCLTAVTTGVASWAEMRRARELWQHEREVYYGLLDIQRRFEFVVANRAITAPEVETFFETIAGVLGSSSHKWARIQEKAST